MTLPASGSISLANLNTEAVNTAGTAISLGSIAARQAAGIPTGAVSFNDLYGKTLPGILDFVQDTSAVTSHSFSNVDIGPADDARRISLIFFGCQKPSAVTSGWTGTSVLLGSTSFVDIGWAWYQGGSGNTDFVAVALHSATVPASEGTTATLSFTTNQAMWCGVAVLGYPKSVTTANHNSFVTSGASVTTLNDTIDNEANGYNILFGCRKNAESVSMSGATKKQQETMNTNYTAFWSIDTVLAATTGRAVSFTGATGAMSILGGLSATP